MKLYYEDAYLKEIETKVVRIDGRNVILDRTIFHPQGAGEPADIGTIGNANVVDVRLVGDEVVHVLDGEPTFKEGDVVKAKIDWQRRYRLMRMHTALHLLFSVCGEILGQNILVVGSNVGEEKSRVDIHLNGSLNAELRSKIENECNELIEKGAEVKVWWDADKPGFRWTQIDEMVKIPCGGLHVKNIKEIERLKILRRERIGKNKDRIEITVA